MTSKPSGWYYWIGLSCLYVASSYVEHYCTITLELLSEFIDHQIQPSLFEEKACEILKTIRFNLNEKTTIWDQTTRIFKKRGMWVAADCDTFESTSTSYSGSSSSSSGGGSDFHSDNDMDIVLDTIRFSNYDTMANNGRDDNNVTLKDVEMYIMASLITDICVASKKPKNSYAKHIVNMTERYTNNQRLKDGKHVISIDIEEEEEEIHQVLQEYFSNQQQENSCMRGIFEKYTMFHPFGCIDNSSLPNNMYNRLQIIIQNDELL